MYKNICSIKILLVENVTNKFNVNVANNSIKLLNANAKYIINKYQSSTMLIICRRPINILTAYTSKNFSVKIIFYMGYYYLSIISITISDP